MKDFLLAFFIKIPAATLIYILLILFGKLSFSLGWLIFAVAIDVIDWIISETT